MYIRYGNTKSNRDMRDLSLSLPLSHSLFLPSEAKRAGKERQPGNTDTHTIELGPSWGQGRGEGLIMLACLCCDDIDMGSSENQNDILN